MSQNKEELLNLYRARLGDAVGTQILDDMLRLAFRSDTKEMTPEQLAYFRGQLDLVREVGKRAGKRIVMGDAE